MRKEDIKWLKANGYAQYSDAHAEKWRKEVKDSAGQPVVLRIRRASERDLELGCGFIYCGKPFVPAGSASKVDCRTVYSDSVQEIGAALESQVTGAIQETPGCAGIESAGKTASLSDDDVHSAFEKWFTSKRPML